jgi:UPF0755 protein
MPVILVVLVLLIVSSATLRSYYFITFRNVVLNGRSSVYFYIPTGTTFDSFQKALLSTGYIRSRSTFEWTTRRMHFGKTVKPGRYLLKEGMTNRQLVNMFRAGRQEPVHVIISSARTREDLAGKIGRQLEPDSMKFLQLMKDGSFLKRFGLTPVTVFALFIPNTYDMYWNISAAGFFYRMYKENKRFWLGDRQKMADSLGLSPIEIITLASIVEKETNANIEKPVIAGVYINRLGKGIPLQADPTVIFAWNDYSIKRVLNKHLEIKSPYNTYKNTGLPPGPICIPSISSIDAVLYYSHHPYLYFCAKEDLSGTHNFAATLAEHSRNAKRYQEALNKLNVR